MEDGKLEKLANAEELRKALARRYSIVIEPEPAKRLPIGEIITGFFTGESVPSSIQKIFQSKQGQGKNS